MKFQVFLIFAAIYGNYCQTQSKARNCGRKFEIETSNRVFGGDEVQSNAWPWLVALFYRPLDTFFCSGNLVSSKHVVSAAHCFKNKREVDVLSAQLFSAFVGKHNLSVLNEPGSTENSILEIILHPDWDSGAARFDADISVVILRDPVEFSERVAPICLPKPSDAEVVGTGTVVGWGKSKRSEAIGKNFDSTPNELQVPAVDSFLCVLTVPDLVYITSSRTFCAGFVNQSKAPCTGDSGGGFYLRDPSTGGFELKGIVSAALLDTHRGCNIEVFSLYTNVAKFVGWIRENVHETKENVWQEIKFDCSEGVWNYTECLHNFRSPITQNMKVRPTFLNHKMIKNAINVENLSLNFKPSTYIFAGIGENFPNLKKLDIPGQPIKFIERQNFAGLTQLESLSLLNNKIEFLLEDVFWDLKNLKELLLQVNRIEKLPENIFRNLKKLKTIKFNDNKIEHLPKDLFADNLEIEVIWANGNPLKTIDVDFTKLGKLWRLQLSDSNCINSGAGNKAQVQEVQRVINQSCKSRKS